MERIIDIDKTPFLGKNGKMGYRNRMRFHRARKTALKVYLAAQKQLSNKED